MSSTTAGAATRPVDGGLLGRLARKPLFGSSEQTAEGYIVGPVYDLFWFILSPAFAMLFGWLVSQNDAAHHDVASGWLYDWGYDGSPLGFLMGVVIMSHIFVVFFRSHLNRDIFVQHKARFTVVPLVWFAALVISPWAFVITSVLATWWDVYHSGAQTFGLARIYDKKAGNDANAGRRLDFWLNQVLYAGPILAGACMMEHVDEFEDFEMVGSAFFSAIPSQVEGVASWLTFGVVAVCVPFLAYYVWAYRRLAKAGHAVSMQKVGLLAITGVVSIWAWGFNSFGEAFVIMNLFHAMQYFAIVWAVEKKTMRRSMRLDRLRAGLPVTLAVFVLVGVAYGVAVELFENNSTFIAATLVVSCMHFWYDGFVWSVRKGQV